MQSLHDFLTTLGSVKFHETLDGLANVYVLNCSNTARFALQIGQMMPINGYARSAHCEQREAIKNFVAKHDFPFFVLYEADWRSKQETVEHWLRHKAGMSPRICSARQAELRTTSGSEAAKFYDRYHLQGRAFHGQHFGLFFEDRLVACLTLSCHKPDRRGRLDGNTFNLVRFALAGSVPGAASRLFRYAVKKMNAREVVTFSDNNYATGGIYTTLGFVPDGEGVPDYRVWHRHYGLRHKSFYQRNKIPTRLRQLELAGELKVATDFDPETDERTEFALCRLMGCKHIWDTGKCRWRWKSDDSCQSALT